MGLGQKCLLSGAVLHSQGFFLTCVTLTGRLASVSWLFHMYAHICPNDGFFGGGEVGGIWYHILIISEIITNCVM